jgi:hypothetical protein
VNEQALIDSEALVEEIGRYLAAVDLFRALECEPTWRPERSPSVLLEQFLSDERKHRSVH